MSKFTEASARLKNAIETITASKMSYNDAGLDQVDTSKQLFANPDLLPNGFPVPSKNTYTLPDDSDYSQKALQAVWNVADLANNIGASHVQTLAKMTNTPALLRNLQYLSAELAPKVIDYSTYALGLALMDFLEVATTDKEAVAALPQEPLRAMIPVLKTRLEIFSAHLPEKRAELEIIAAFKEKIAKFKAEFEQIDWLKLAASEPTSLQDLDRIVLEHNHIVAGFESSLTHFDVMLHEWFNEHSGKFPLGNVVSSKFHELTADKHQDELFDLWKGLFNRMPEPDFLVTSNPYQAGKDLFQQGQIALNALKQQVLNLQAKRETFQALAVYEEALVKAIQQTKDLALPEFLKQTDKGLIYQITLSSDSNRKVALKADKKNYAELIKKLRVHNEELGQLQRTLQEQYDHFAFPVADDHPLFEKAREKALVQLLSRIKHVEKQREMIQDLVLEAAGAEAAVSKSILQLTQEGRREILRTLEDRIRFGFTKE